MKFHQIIQKVLVGGIPLYPNPPTDKITLKLNGEKTKILVEDISHKILFQTETKEIEPSLDLTGYSSGTYFIRTIQNEKLEQLK